MCDVVKLGDGIVGFIKTTEFFNLLGTNLQRIMRNQNQNEKNVGKGLNSKDSKQELKTLAQGLRLPDLYAIKLIKHT